MIKNVKNFFPLKQLFAKKTIKTQAPSQNLLPSDVKMKQPLQEDVFEKTQKSEDIKGDELVEQKSVENLVDENPNQTSKKNAEETSIDKTNDSSYNVESEDVKVGEAKKVEEKQITEEMINKKLEELYYLDIDEPEYHSLKSKLGDNPSVAYTAYHYDKNSVLRKKVVMTFAGYISEIELYDENENLRYIAKRVFENDVVPTLHIMRYYISGEGQSCSSDVKQDNYVISELDFNS